MRTHAHGRTRCLEYARRVRHQVFDELSWVVQMSLPLRVLLGSLFVASCGSDGVAGIVGTTSQTVVANVGDEVQITLGNVGPGEYVSPPQISSAVLTFLSVDVVPPYTPAGPNQRFRFKAIARGQAIVSFRRFLNASPLGPAVDDTVKVR